MPNRTPVDQGAEGVSQEVKDFARALRCVPSGAPFVLTDTQQAFIAAASRPGVVLRIRRAR
jgi:histidinol-phosphate/aromatic aminotransferase/cobyric acid decarboxylase-like protein